MNVFKYFLPQTLKSKLRIALFGIGFFPYLLILIYSHNLGEEKILDNALTAYETQMRETKSHINEQLLSLKKEIHFLSSLDIMNDMIVRDIDKRITHVLIKKQEDLAFDMHLFTLNTDNEIIASSDMLKKHDFTYANQFKNTLLQDKDYFFTSDSIVMFTPFYSTLDNNQLLGYMFAEYALRNLSQFTVHERGIRSMLYNPHLEFKIGEVYIDEIVNLEKSYDNYLSDKHLILHERLEGILSEWSIVYMIQKSVALVFLDQFILFVWGLFGFGFVVIISVSFWMSKRILDPIAKLSEATKSIISTKDYTTQVSDISKGEVGELTDDFNAMIRETNNAFTVLEEENKFRLLRFIQLINIFNGLIQTQTEKACISLALQELSTLMPHQVFSFSFAFPISFASPVKEASGQMMMLYVQNFEQQSCDFYGVINIKNLNTIVDEHEEKFYRSIATMIMLQLDQIRLINKTQEVSRAKSTFISHLSHELRTPLHMILSSTQYLIGYENLTLNQQKTIATMESSADHLLGMINDILDLVQIEAGKVTVIPLEQDSDEIEILIQDIITMLEVLVEDKNVSITLDNRLTKRKEVIIDIKLLKQIMINLLSNAIKFTHEGSIEFLMIECENMLCIEIKDSGIGISNENMDRLFDEFVQLDNKDQQKGSGLGLVISKKLANLFDADIALFSEGEGKGTTVTVQLKSINL